MILWIYIFFYSDVFCLSVSNLRYFLQKSVDDYFIRVPNLTYHRTVVINYYNGLGSRQSCIEPRLIKSLPSGTVQILKLGPVQLLKKNFDKLCCTLIYFFFELQLKLNNFYFIPNSLYLHKNF